MQQSTSILELVKSIKTQIQECDIFHIKSMLDQDKLDGILVDVREEQEFCNSHIPGATHLSRGIIDVKIEHLIPNKQQKIYLYCAAGLRSALSAESLQRIGYNNVISIDGGFGHWVQNKFDTSNGDI